ncbi:Cinnamoyl-coa reductase protein [Thalictrum thalictroides]|uniref:Cinnamoyl-coa reductase protein n=1 Tax=Thalictrum thalictroides TaxID=46969 RepID=A0A7J6VBP5_THATH|nr:Cinnamoyl-coa reductase protein [Thalictrum thalictroides]
MDVGAYFTPRLLLILLVVSCYTKYMAELEVKASENSEELVCRDKKLWFALGNTMATRAAWRLAEDRELKLATIYAGFLTGPDFFRSQEMCAEGLLATTEVSKVAEAHVCLYEALRNMA